MTLFFRIWYHHHVQNRFERRVRREAGTQHEKSTTGQSAPVVLLVLPLPDAMPQWHPRLRGESPRCIGSGADAAIACPGQVAGSSRNGQEITSFVAGST
jgi:hypothetical protein